MPAELAAKVSGRCPMGCGRTLFLANGDHVTCSWAACPDPSAADHMLNSEHVRWLMVNTTGFESSWLPSEIAAIEAIKEANDFDAVRVYEIRVPAWRDADNEEALIARARDEVAEAKAVADRIERAARAIHIATTGDAAGVWGSLRESYREDYRRAARAALAAGEQSGETER